MVTVEERRRQIRDREEMLRNTETLTEEEKASLREQLSVRDRLMLRLKSTRIPVTFRDPLGDFTVEVRLMTASERDRFIRYNALIEQGKTFPEKLVEGLTGLKALAGDICVTEGLDAAYWGGPDVSDDVVMSVCIASWAGVARDVREQIDRFRPK